MNGLSGLTHYLRVLLGGFGGGAGASENELMHVLLAASLWSILYFAARRRLKTSPQPRERYLVWGFGLAALRDLYLFALFSLDIIGVLRTGDIPVFFSGVDHLMSLAAMIGLGAAFVQYLLEKPDTTRRFVLAATAASAVILALGLARQGLNLQQGFSSPGVRPPPWYDSNTHLAQALVLASAMLLILPRRGWMKNLALASFSLFLVHDLLIFLPEPGSAEVEATVHSLRHALRIVAVIILGLLYFRETGQERRVAQEETRRALEETENERRKSEGIIAALGDGLSIQDSAMRIVYQNKVSRDIMGDHLGEYCYAAYAGRDEPCRDCPIGPASPEVAIRTIERSPLIRGVRRHLEIKASTVRDASGRVLAGIELVRDITSRKRAEEDLRIKTRAVEGSSSPIALAGLDGRLSYVNRSFLEMWNFKDDKEVLGRRITDFWHSEKNATVVMAAFLSQGRWAGELKGKRSDGSSFDVQVQAGMITDHLGRPLCMMASFLDITDRKRAEEQLRSAQEELARKYEELRQLDVIKDGLLRDVTHELKTPVAKHAMHLELLRKMLLDEQPGDPAQILEVMERTVRRQEVVIRNLLDLSRLKAGGRIYSIRPVRLDKVVLKVLEDYRLPMARSDITLETSLVPVTVLAEEEMVWHAVSNLVSNAIKFRNKGGPGRIAITVRRDGDRAALTVKDDGIGMDAEELARAFDTFYQASASVEGSGVGLSIAKRIVEGMGGSVTLDSEGTGKGTAAVMTLLLAREADHGGDA